MRRTFLLLLCGSLLLLPVETEARRRKPTGRLTGRIDVRDPSFAKLAPRFTKAYWRFGLPALRERRWRPDPREFLIFLTAWDNKGKIKSTDVAIHGAELTPRLLVLPRITESINLTLHNKDRFIYRLRSKLLGEIEAHPGVTRQVPLRGIPPCVGGDFTLYTLQDAGLPTTRGHVLVLCSSHYTFASGSGRFRLDKVPRGEHKLKIFYRGRVLHEQKIEVKRKTKLKTIKLTLQQ